MVLQFLGADREVTGSCHYVKFGDKHFLVDCGMEQGPDLYVNQEIPVNAATVDYVFVTHAHTIMGFEERFLQRKQLVSSVILC